MSLRPRKGCMQRKRAPRRLSEIIENLNRTPSICLQNFFRSNFLFSEPFTALNFQGCLPRLPRVGPGQAEPGGGVLATAQNTVPMAAYGEAYGGLWPHRTVPVAYRFISLGRGHFTFSGGRPWSPRRDLQCDAATSHTSSGG